MARTRAAAKRVVSIVEKEVEVPAVRRTKRPGHTVHQQGETSGRDKRRTRSVETTTMPDSSRSTEGGTDEEQVHQHQGEDERQSSPCILDDARVDAVEWEGSDTEGEEDSDFMPSRYGGETSDATDVGEGSKRGARRKTEPSSVRGRSRRRLLGGDRNFKASRLWLGQDDVHVKLRSRCLLGTFAPNDNIFGSSGEVVYNFFSSAIVILG